MKKSFIGNTFAGATARGLPVVASEEDCRSIGCDKLGEDLI